MIKLSDYVITPRDIVRGFRWRYLIGATIGLALIVGSQYAGIGLDVALFVSAVAMAVIWKMDARLPFGAAIACFVAIMVATVMAPSGSTNTQGSLREQLAVVAFYCLVIGVALLIREQIARPKGQELALAGAAASMNSADASSDEPADAPAPRPTQPATTFATRTAAPKPSSAAILSPSNQPMAPAYKPHLAPHPALRKTAPVVQHHSTNPAHRPTPTSFPTRSGIQSNKHAVIPGSTRNPVPNPARSASIPMQPVAHNKRIIDGIMPQRPAHPQQPHHRPMPAQHRPHPRLVQL